VTQRLKAIADTQASAMEILTALEARLDVFREEFQRASTIIHRLKLAQENDRSLARRQSEAISRLGEKLDRIETMLRAGEK